MDATKLDPKRFASHDTATILKMLRACESVTQYLINSTVTCDMSGYVNELNVELKTRGVVVDEA
jgi:hypothetical protein